MRPLGRQYIPYDIPLGEGEHVRLVLPQDMTTAEADRICGVIRTLAFPDEVLAEAAQSAAGRNGESGEQR